MRKSKFERKVCRWQLCQFKNCLTGGVHPIPIAPNLRAREGDLHQPISTSMASNYRVFLFVRDAQIAKICDGDTTTPCAAMVVSSECCDIVQQLSIAVRWTAKLLRRLNLSCSRTHFLLVGVNRSFTARVDVHTKTRYQKSRMNAGLDGPCPLPNSARALPPYTAGRSL